MDKSDWTIDDYVKKGNKAYAEILKVYAKLNLIEYQKKQGQNENRNKVRHR